MQMKTQKKVRANTPTLNPVRPSWLYGLPLIGLGTLLPVLGAQADSTPLKKLESHAQELDRLSGFFITQGCEKKLSEESKEVRTAKKIAQAIALGKTCVGNARFPSSQYLLETLQKNPDGSLNSCAKKEGTGFQELQIFPTAPSPQLTACARAESEIQFHVNKALSLKLNRTDLSSLQFADKDGALRAPCAGDQFDQNVLGDDLHLIARQIADHSITTKKDNADSCGVATALFSKVWGKDGSDTGGFQSSRIKPVVQALNSNRALKKCTFSSAPSQTNTVQIAHELERQTKELKNQAEQRKKDQEDSRTPETSPAIPPEAKVKPEDLSSAESRAAIPQAFDGVKLVAPPSATQEPRRKKD